MKIRPQMIVSLLAVGCMGLAGVHFATAQQEKPRQSTQKLQRPDNAQDQQRDVQKRGNARQRTDGRSDNRTRVESKTRTSSSVSILRTSTIIGAQVSISGGTSLGTIQEFVINDGGCVDYVIVSYDNRLVPVPWMAGTFRTDDRVFLLDISENQIAQLPTFTEFTQLSDATFVTKVNTFFRVDEKRRDRRDGDSKDRSKSARDDRKPGRDGAAKDDADKDAAGKDAADKDAAGKTESGKSPRDAGKSPGKSRDAAPKTQERPKAGSTEPKSGSEPKKTEAPKKADEPKQDSTEK